jgi:LemA protein
VSVLYTILIVLGLLAITLFSLAMGYYNRLIQLRNEKDNGWSQIDVQLKRRHDLVPNLVATVKGYMNHERELLEEVTRARGQAMNASGVGQQSVAENLLTQALGQLRVTIENYPDLKANQNVLALQEELASTENRIAFARQFYNDAVMRFNTKLEMFPSNIVGNVFRFEKAEFFEIEDPRARAVPEASFGPEA